MKEKRLTQNFELSAELKKAIKEQATKKCSPQVRGSASN